MLSSSSWVFHTLNKSTAKTSSLAPPHFKNLLRMRIYTAIMASRALSLVRRGVRGTWLLPRRSYVNGENVIPLTFSSPNLVRTYPKPSLGALEIESNSADLLRQCFCQANRREVNHRSIWHPSPSCSLYCCASTRPCESVRVRQDTELLW